MFALLDNQGTSQPKPLRSRMKCQDMNNHFILISFLANVRVMTTRENFINGYHNHTVHDGFKCISTDCTFLILRTTNVSENLILQLIEARVS